MLNIILTFKTSLEVMLNRLFGVKSQKGVTMIEYALIAALIAITLIVILGTVSGSLNDIFQAIADALDAAHS